MFRQGDILLTPATVPAGTTDVQPTKNGYVLALGERTGHMHRFSAGEHIRVVAFRRDPQTTETFVTLLADAELRHDGPSGGGTGEHAPITVPAGDYRVVRQREWSPEGERRVED